MVFLRSFGFLIIIGLFLCAGSACAPIIDNRGNFPEENRLKEVIPGKTSSVEVERLLGSPSSRSLFGEETWYYVASKQQRFAFYKTKELERNVLAIVFDESGLVSSMNFYDFDDAVKVDLAKRETKTYGHSISLWEQLLGNLGRFESSKE